jgi:hypothetical protein
MKGLAIGVWVVLLGILFFGWYFFAVFAIEFVFVGVLYYYKPEWFKK